MDDLLSIGDKELTNNFKASIRKYFTTTPAIDTSYILSIRILQDRPNLRILLDQIEYAKHVVKQFVRATLP